MLLCLPCSANMPPQLQGSLDLLEQYALAEDRNQAAADLSSQLGGKTAAFLKGERYCFVVLAFISPRTGLHRRIPLGKHLYHLSSSTKRFRDL